MHGEVLLQDSFTRKRHSFIPCGSSQIPSKNAYQVSKVLNLYFRLRQNLVQRNAHNSAELNNVICEPSLSKCQEILLIKQCYVVYSGLTVRTCEVQESISYCLVISGQTKYSGLNTPDLHTPL